MNRKFQANYMRNERAMNAMKILSDVEVNNDRFSKRMRKKRKCVPKRLANLLDLTEF